jgi:protein CpxP
MRKTTLAVVGAVGLALGVGGAAVLAQPPGPEGQRGARPGWGRTSGMARFLGLDDAQKEQLKTLMQSRRADHQALWEQARKNREQMKAALESANPDPVAIGELAIEGHRLRQQGQALREAQDKAIRAILTPEQQVRFDAMKALRAEGGPWGGPKGGPGMHRGGPRPEQP